MPHQEDIKAGVGVGRGVLLGAALWCIVGVVAFALNSTGDARDTDKDRTHGASVVTVDRGGHTDARR
jgi:hypothetical protein